MECPECFAKVPADDMKRHLAIHVGCKTVGAIIHQQ
jgi:hypothetical protein